MDKRFSDIIQLIQQSRNSAIKAVNVQLINLYWNVGSYIKDKPAVAGWGDKTVEELATFVQKNNPELKGFNRRGLYRIIQFYETYAPSKLIISTEQQTLSNDNSKIVSSVRTQFEPKNIRNTILVQLSWTHHRTIFSRCKMEEEREFYIRLCIRENYSVRELDRQISASLFERTMIGNSKLSPEAKAIHIDIASTFKDSYVLEFLNV
ncbi:DUF1016 N-terminal domain-containing protein [Sphingobacterium pedocola]|uniref:YhcG N-terminal domain-containing protein n=1 Tax=Sphingobacterium pedocola TaxID=2082722 RepID=A0ABR9T7Q1_9SPHI|nr:DUF1016 N-terminal domain-containing protein [Sphingobacterium pedocola]MBE8721379.1 hypothetical protein [Sphingobacterium pedocola]